jgi:hypothetical protein
MNDVNTCKIPPCCVWQIVQRSGSVISIVTINRHVTHTHTHTHTHTVPIMTPFVYSRQCGKQKRNEAGHRCLTPVILATQEAEMRRIAVQARPA